MSVAYRADFVNIHGYSRSTGNLDIWVDVTPENYARLVKAFADFRMPLFDMTLERFLNTEEYDVFSFGVPPSAIDLLTKAKGLDFTVTYANSTVYELDELAVRVISFNDLLRAKEAAGRYRDLNDLEQLRKLNVGEGE